MFFLTLMARALASAIIKLRKTLLPKTVSLNKYNSLLNLFVFRKSGERGSSKWEKSSVGGTHLPMFLAIFLVQCEFFGLIFDEMVQFE